MVDLSVPAPAAMLKRSIDSRLLKLTLLITSVLTVMVGAVVSPDLPAIQTHFADTDPLTVRLILTLPALFIALSSPFAGYIVDRMGRKGLLVGAVLLYALTGSSAYLTTSLPLLLIGRALLGIAAAGVMTSVTTLVTDYYAGPARSQFLGIQSAFMALGASVILTLSGTLADSHWQTPFLLYTSAFFVLPLVMLVLYEPVRESPSPVTAADPITVADRVPVRLLLFIYPLVVFVQVIFGVIPLQLPFHLLELTGATGAVSGLAVSAATMSFALSSALFSSFQRRFGSMRLLTFGLLLTGVAFLAISQATGWALIIPGLIGVGFGTGQVMPNLQVWLADASPAAVRGRLMGGFTTAVFAGQFLTPLMSQPLLDAFNTGGMYLLIGIWSLMVGGLTLLPLLRQPRP